MTPSNKHVNIQSSSVGKSAPWSVVLYLMADGTIPARDFLMGCPQAISARFLATLDAIAAAPPPRFSGGGAWETMHGAMSGWYEVRLTGPRREQFLLFAC